MNLICCDRSVGYAICDRDTPVLTNLSTRCQAASPWYEQLRDQLALQPELGSAGAALTAADVAQLANDLR